MRLWLRSSNWFQTRSSKRTRIQDRRTLHQATGQHIPQQSTKIVQQRLSTCEPGSGCQQAPTARREGVEAKNLATKRQPLNNDGEDTFGKGPYVCAKKGLTNLPTLSKVSVTAVCQRLSVFKSIPQGPNPRGPLCYQQFRPLRSLCSVHQGRTLHRECSLPPLSRGQTCPVVCRRFFLRSQGNHGHYFVGQRRHSPQHRSKMLVRSHRHTSRAGRRTTSSPSRHESTKHVPTCSGR